MTSYSRAFGIAVADALGMVEDGHVLGLGSGRAATAFVRALGRHVNARGMDVMGVPTSLQIKAVAEASGVPVVEADRVEAIDTVFDGTDQVDADGYMIKGGGGALLREGILIGCAKKVVIMADETKFVRRLNRAVPVEVHPHARRTAAAAMRRLGGTPSVRTIGRGYPFFTENGNIVLDCDFGTIKYPRRLSDRMIRVAGVMESGIFTRRPDVMYKAKAGGRCDILT